MNCKAELKPKAWAFRWLFVLFLNDTKLFRSKWTTHKAPTHEENPRFLLERKFMWKTQHNLLWKTKRTVSHHYNSIFLYSFLPIPFSPTAIHKNTKTAHNSNHNDWIGSSSSGETHRRVMPGRSVLLNIAVAISKSLAHYIAHILRCAGIVRRNVVLFLQRWGHRSGETQMAHKVRSKQTAFQFLHGHTSFGKCKFGS